MWLLPTKIIPACMNVGGVINIGRDDKLQLILEKLSIANALRMIMISNEKRSTTFVILICTKALVATTIQMFLRAASILLVVPVLVVSSES